MSRRRTWRTSMPHDVRGLARDAGVYAEFRRVGFHYPPVCEVMTRVVRRIGEDIKDPRTGFPLVPGIWADRKPEMVRLHEIYGGNNKRYLQGMLKHVLAPIEFALHVRTVTGDGDEWVPDGKALFKDWHEAHPGEISVSLGRDSGMAERVLVRRRIAAPIYLDCL